MRPIDADALVKAMGKALNEFEDAYVPLTDVAICMGKTIKDAPTVDIKTEVAREIFGEIEFDIANLDFDREETRAIAIEGVIAELKNKYIGGAEE